MDYDSMSISYEAFKERFEGISNPRDAALIATIYCAYGRVGEVVRNRYNKRPSIKKEHFKWTPSHLILSVLTEKTNLWRRVPTSRGLEDWLHEPIRNYLSYVSTDEVFPISTFWAECIFKKWFGTFHIHLLRHWACTHALQGHRTKERLSAQYAARLGGWVDLKTFYRTYSHFVVEDFIEMI